MADIDVTLGLNATQLKSELLEARKEIAGLKDATAGAADPTERLAQGHDKLLASSHRVATQVGHLSRDLASGASGAQVFESAIIGLERSLNLPLGALAGLAGVGYIAKEIYDVTEAAKKLHAEITKLTDQSIAPTEYTALTVLNKQLGETAKKLEELQGSTGFLKQISEAIGSQFGSDSKESLPEALDRVATTKKTDAAKLFEFEETRKQGVADKQAEENKIEDIRQREGQFAADREKIEAESKEKFGAAVASGNAALIPQLDREKELKLKAVDQKEEEKADKESAKDELDVIAADTESKVDRATEQKEARDEAQKEEDRRIKEQGDEDDRKKKEAIQEAGDAKKEAAKKAAHDAKVDEQFAKNPAGVSLHDYATQGSGRVAAEAQEAEREEKIAKQRQLVGDTESAMEHQDRAEQLKKSLGLPNKDDAKDATVKALNEAKVLQDIEKNTRDEKANL